MKTIQLSPSWCWPILVLEMSIDEGPVCLGCGSWCDVTLLAPDDFPDPGMMILVLLIALASPST